MADRSWDLTSTNSLQAACGWLLKNAGPDALFACVVRVDDLAIAGDMKLLPREVLNLFELHLARMEALLEANRTEYFAKRARQQAREAKKVSK